MITLSNPVYIFFTATLICVFVLSALFTRLIIPKLKSLKLGQTILDIGPRWHKNKEGTPTMGGVAFISAILAVCALAVFLLTRLTEAALPTRLIITLVFAVANGAIGVIDDMTKFKNHRNEGLSASQKFLLQLLAGGLYLAAMSYFGGLTTVMHIPFTNFGFDLGVVYYPIALILIAGIVNSVNLTDGIDGLASSVTLVAAAAFAVLSFFIKNTELSLLSAALIGGCLGFLTYNFYPARIFMGDTGSLFLGAGIVGCAFLANDPLIILIIGIIYVIESLSVIIQVTCFKLTGKRVFKMSPIHHHFEKCGWSEIKIVSIFSLLTLIISTLAVVLTLV
ncbi:MAG: phospho-N-acetylmuramoyl-pentapeptide-transferase [Clostridia bacterium]|nr:phospho-N-acetylmuramoyl-pentapeptide-transferase [Clostridia bacterium]